MTNEVTAENKLHLALYGHDKVTVRVTIAVTVRVTVTIAVTVTISKSYAHCQGTGC